MKEQRSFSLAFRIFLAYSAFVALGGWFVAREVLDEVKPAVRQSTEETLVDTAHLLAEILSDDVASGTLDKNHWPRLLEKYGSRRPNASIWGFAKSSVNHRIYVVDARGKVLLDSSGRDVGKDYSRWNDVYSTLRGRYGVRSTRVVPGDDRTSVMYVAAPIYSSTEIVGAVTVAKPNHTVEPFIESAKRRLLWLGIGFVLVGLALGAFLSFWLSRSVRKLTNYARQVSGGERTPIPDLPGGELSHLASALDRMRTELDGRAYIERYAQTLTHELKTPLAAIRGAAELLHDEMPSERRKRFVQNIESETTRLEALSERLLLLAQVEKRSALEERARIPLRAGVAELHESARPRLEKNSIEFENLVDEEATIEGERFLVFQAFGNLLDNALDFSDPGGTIVAKSAPATEGGADFLELSLENTGPNIPDYALPRVTERFYSLARPGTGRKSTGLGLNFVAEVAELHGGSFRIENLPGGVRATLKFPLF